MSFLVPSRLEQGVILAHYSHYYLLFRCSGKPLECFRQGNNKWIQILKLFTFHSLAFRTFQCLIVFSTKSRLFSWFFELWPYSFSSASFPITASLFFSHIELLIVSRAACAFAHAVSSAWNTSSFTLFYLPSPFGKALYHFQGAWTDRLCPGLSILLVLCLGSIDT